MSIPSQVALFMPGSKSPTISKDTTMSDRPSTGKRASRTAGANTLITATSLALTLSGWAVLGGVEEAVAPAPAESAATAIVLSALPPLPTIVPPPDLAGLPTDPAGDQASAPQAAAAPRRVVRPAPTAAPLAAPVAPPQPVTVTRSSR